MHEAAAAPARETVEALLRAVPPVRRYSDVLRELVSAMDAWGFGGSRQIAQTLARAGIRIGRETVRRWRRLPRRPPTSPCRHARPLPVRARRPNDIWLIDLTDLHGFSRLRTWKVAAVLDAHARLPIAAQEFTHEPTAADCARLVRVAVGRVGRPRSLVSDRGTQFTARRFGSTLKRLRIRHRCGSVGQPSATALLERFWRPLKALTRVKTHPPLTHGDLAARLDLALRYYNAYRPHASLGGATPLQAAQVQLLVLVGMLAAESVSAALTVTLVGPTFARYRPTAVR